MTVRSDSLPLKAPQDIGLPPPMSPPPMPVAAAPGAAIPPRAPRARKPAAAPAAPAAPAQVQQGIKVVQPVAPTGPCGELQPVGPAIRLDAPPSNAMALWTKLSPDAREYLSYLLAVEEPGLFERLAASGAETLAFLSRAR